MTGKEKAGVKSPQTHLFRGYELGGPACFATARARSRAFLAQHGAPSPSGQPAQPQGRQDRPRLQGSPQMPLPWRLRIVRPAFLLEDPGTTGVRGEGPTCPLPTFGASPEARRPSAAPVRPRARAAVAGLLPSRARRARQPGEALRRARRLPTPLLRTRIRDSHVETPAAMSLPISLVLLRHV
ncbi:hypothetical protein HPB48_010591 [Haemaphysalis longicornis]|uniref:Uncharacterized protein n=1 Tax=Haemaphysalis longicornis TaxID=44386 RepID=A0A9J6H533_HAELO|nr:hypothetical protein HPB48_010591 [Haemaphysalis longicornis]